MCASSLRDSPRSSADHRALRDVERRVMLAVDGLKICSSCRNQLPVTGFFKNRGAQDGVQNQCKPCHVYSTKRWKYLLKTGQYEAMVESQDGRCAICQQVAKKLVIDHCHKTEKLRALLCRKCNALLGMCLDDVKILNAAIQYLDQWTEE